VEINVEDENHSVVDPRRRVMEWLSSTASVNLKYTQKCAKLCQKCAPNLTFSARNLLNLSPPHNPQHLSLSTCLPPPYVIPEDPANSRIPEEECNKQFTVQLHGFLLSYHICLKHQYQHMFFF